MMQGWHVINAKEGHQTVQSVQSVYHGCVCVIDGCYCVVRQLAELVKFGFVVHHHPREEDDEEAEPIPGHVILSMVPRWAPWTPATEWNRRLSGSGEGMPQFMFQ